jgi:hypothetical protein
MITPAEIVRGALKRFLPGAAIGALATSSVFGLTPFAAAVWPRWVGGSIFAAVLASLGFAAIIFLARRYLRPDAEIAGRKSVVAGFAAAAAAFTILSFSGSYLVMSLSLFRFSAYQIGRTLAIPVLAGAVATFAIYFPWISRHPEEEGQPIFAQPMTGAARFMLRRLSTRLERQQ